jgi:predicted dehydrogenase
MELNVGVIGCGNISRFHFDGLAKAKARVGWVCDINEQAARPWAQRLEARLTRDYREVLADRTVNVVDITTLSRLHKSICLEAIGAGKAIICEKTLAENADDALAIVREATQRQTLFYTSYMKRFIPAVQKAKQLLPALGRIISTHIRGHQCWGDLWSAAPASGFFHTPPGGQSSVRASYGGGILVCGGSHLLDLVCFLLGRPRRLYAEVCTPSDRDYDLRATALMHTDHGIVHFEALAHPLDRIGFLRDGWDEQIEIIGTHGKLQIFSAQWDQVDLKASLLVHYDKASATSTEHRFDPVSPFERAIGFFCDNIRANNQGEQPRTSGYDVDELIAAVQLSSQTRQAVDVNYRI